jgi:sugar phosphate isomerase/epimerase
MTRHDPAGLSRLSINQATTRPQWSLREAIEGYAAAGVGAISVWPDKLAECGIANARRLLDDNGMAVTSYCAGGLFAAAGQPFGPRPLDACRRLLDDAAAIGAACMVSVVTTLEAERKDLEEARRRVADALGVLADHARAVEVPLAIEPVHPMLAGELCCINTLSQANELCDALGAGAGIALDLYHVWWDPDLEAEISRAGERILVFQICDWLRQTVALRNDRGMMGDGVIDIAGIRRLVEDSGYRGYCDVEVMSERQWWRRPAEEVVATCVERFQTVC